ncbi:GH25 family lysozyme [Microvirga aerophila]|uniref:Lysozyme n=1 Tax=Microvirga aerophila TaxID=670291 RepID=A0A512BRI2_9HYPH|nr:GH25 family lysozyme [Microvirga aerophila]GEO14568.1 lysozyme [Microvirga aerophila]
MSKRGRIIIAVVAFCFAAAVTGAIVVSYLFWYYEPDRRAFPVRGIDVSHHQGTIGWHKVAADNVAFAFIKASEGGDHRDRLFSRNWNEAEAAGVKVGAYQFFTSCRSGRDQANNFLQVLGERKGTLPAALDLEFGGNCAAKPDAPEIRREIESFLEPVESKTGMPVVLYVTAEFWDAYKDILPARPLWVRSIFRRPSQSEWTFWQYHHAGSVSGITGRVDLNVVRSEELFPRLASEPAARKP